MQVRTDLAEEAQALWRQSAGKTTQLEGVKARSWEEHGVGRHQVQILNEQGEKALGKPRGTYETLWVPGDGRPTPEAAEALGEAVRDLLDLRGGESVLVVGLGNRAMTPDAVGPLSAGGILVTRHLRQQLPQIFAGVRPVSALVPGVLGTTGVESAEIVQSVVEATRPDRVVVVDALAAGSADRLCRVIQVTDAGIVPGSGVGNHRAALNRETLGVPVFAIGVPTVVDSATLAADILEESGVEKVDEERLRGEHDAFMVTTRDIDQQVRDLSKVVGYGINWALQDLEIEEMNALLS